LRSCHGSLDDRDCPDQLAQRHGGQHILIVRLAVPPLAPPDVRDAKAGRFVDTPHERWLIDPEPCPL